MVLNEEKNFPQGGDWSNGTGNNARNWLSTSALNQLLTQQIRSAFHTERFQEFLKQIRWYFSASPALLGSLISCQALALPQKKICIITGANTGISIVIHKLLKLLISPGLGFETARQLVATGKYYVIMGMYHIFTLGAELLF